MSRQFPWSGPSAKGWRSSCSGCGITPADLDPIVDALDTTKSGGTGFVLGPGVSYGLIATHGGELPVASEVGRGSVIRIGLPPQPAPTLAAATSEVT